MSRKLKPRDPVEAFAEKFFRELERGHWGDISPDTFFNIASGFTGNEDLDTYTRTHLYFDKMDPTEMLAEVKAMRAILTKLIKKA